MTTAWSLAMHGRLVEALGVHATGTLLAAVTAAASVTAIAVAVRGRWFAWRPSEAVVVGVCIATVALVLVEWTLRLAMG